MSGCVFKRALGFVWHSSNILREVGVRVQTARICNISRTNVCPLEWVSAGSPAPSRDGPTPSPRSLHGAEYQSQHSLDFAKALFSAYIPRANVIWNHYQPVLGEKHSTNIPSEIWFDNHSLYLICTGSYVSKGWTFFFLFKTNDLQSYRRKKKSKSKTNSFDLSPSVYIPSCQAFLTRKPLCVREEAKITSFSQKAKNCPCVPCNAYGPKPPPRAALAASLSGTSLCLAPKFRALFGKPSSMDNFCCCCCCLFFTKRE